MRPVARTGLRMTAAVASAKPLPPETRERLGKLLLMLSSDHAGEKTAAADAIGKLLHANGADWHDLAAQLLGEPTTAPDQSQPQPHAARTRWDGNQLRAVADEVLESGCYLNDKARGFLRDLKRRSRLWSRVELSQKQLEWLVALAERARSGETSTWQSV